VEGDQPTAQRMNYIRHTRAAFELLARTAEATPYHVSLYVALFQQWNEARFPADIVLFKDEVMQAAHIGSPKTYRACLRDLSAWGLITYQPSHSEYRASRALMHELPTADAPLVGPHSTQAVPKRRPPGPATSNPTTGATSAPSHTPAVPPFDKPDANLTKPLSENGTPFSRTAVAPEKKRGEDAEDDNQHLESDDSDQTAQTQKDSAHQANRVAPKRKSSGSPSPPGRASGGARRPEIPFADSELAPLDTFLTAFVGTDYELANLRYYHELVGNWRQHGEPPRRRDWLATSKKFMLNDMQDGKLKLASSATYPRGSAGPLTQAEFGAAVDEYADGRYA